MTQIIKQASCPGPKAAKQPQTITLPPPCLSDIFIKCIPSKNLKICLVSPQDICPKAFGIIKMYFGMKSLKCYGSNQMFCVIFHLLCSCVRFSQATKKITYTHFECAVFFNSNKKEFHLKTPEVVSVVFYISPGLIVIMPLSIMNMSTYVCVFCRCVCVLWVCEKRVCLSKELDFTSRPHRKTARLRND